MTEPLLFGLALVALWAVDDWVRSPRRGRTVTAGVALGAMMLCRYEGWAIGGALVAWAAWRRGVAAWPLAGACAGAVAAFLVLSRATTGTWFVTSGFFVPDNPSRHDVVAVLGDVFGATRTLAGDAVLAAAAAGALLGIAALREPSGGTILLALAAAAALPISAFYEGHPFRVRYMVPLVVASGALAGLAVARVPARARSWVAVVLVAVAFLTRPPFDPNAPMVTEAQWETPYRLGRENISRYLDAEYDGTPILASMGSLAHYMQEASRHGLRLANFLHEGNGILWTAALRSPRRHVRWVAIEQQAEGGDMLAALVRDDPTFLEGFDEVAQGGGVALFRRRE